MYWWPRQDLGRAPRSDRGSKRMLPLRGRTIQASEKAMALEQSPCRSARAPIPRRGLAGDLEEVPLVGLVLGSCREERTVQTQWADLMAH